MRPHRVCRADDLPPGGRIVGRIEGREVVVVNCDGTFYVIRNRCAHQGGPIGEGRVTRTVVASERSAWEPEIASETRVLRCPWHGLEYNLATGQAICDPRWRIKVYNARVRDDYVEILL